MIQSQDGPSRTACPAPSIAHSALLRLKTIELLPPPPPLPSTTHSYTTIISTLFKTFPQRFLLQRSGWRTSDERVGSFSGSIPNNDNKSQARDREERGDNFSKFWPLYCAIHVFSFWLNVGIQRQTREGTKFTTAEHDKPEFLHAPQQCVDKDRLVECIPSLDNLASESLDLRRFSKAVQVLGARLVQTVPQIQAEDLQLTIMKLTQYRTLQSMTTDSNHTDCNQHRLFGQP